MTDKTPQPERRNTTPQKPETVDIPESAVNQPEVRPGEPLRFDGERSEAKRDDQAVKKTPALATGMFLPVLIILIVAIVIIVWFLL